MYPVLGLESEGRLLRHFQTPVLYWINFSLRQIFPEHFTIDCTNFRGDGNESLSWSAPHPGFRAFSWQSHSPTPVLIAFLALPSHKISGYRSLEAQGFFNQIQGLIAPEIYQFAFLEKLSVYINSADEDLLNGVS